MPSSVPLSISVICLPIGHLLQLLSVTSYQYIVALSSGAQGLVESRTPVPLSPEGRSHNVKN